MPGTSEAEAQTLGSGTYAGDVADPDEDGMRIAEFSLDREHSESPPAGTTEE